MQLESDVIKDIKEYKSTYFGGMNAKQLISIFISIILTGVVSYIIDLFGYFELGLLKVILPFTCFPIVFGWLEIGGMSIHRFLLLYIKFEKEKNIKYEKANLYVKKEKKWEKLLKKDTLVK